MSHKPRKPTVPREAHNTIRRQIAEAIEGRDVPFDALRRQLSMPIRQLADDLKHVLRTLEAEGRVVRITPAACLSCDYEYTERKHLHTPSRCPKCRSNRITDALFFLEPLA